MSDRGVQRLKLMPDYLCEMPLWRTDPLAGQVRAGSDLVGLPPSLLEELGKWQADFDANFDPFDGLDESVRAA